MSGSSAFLERPEALRLVQTAPAHMAARGNAAGLLPMVAHLGRGTVHVSKTAKFLEELGINFDTRCQNSIRMTVVLLHRAIPLRACAPPRTRL